jgi:hypothetical protein
LLFIYILYLCLGAVVFSVLECPEELDGRRVDLDRMVRFPILIRYTPSVVLRQNVA